MPASNKTHLVNRLCMSVCSLSIRPFLLENRDLLRSNLFTDEQIWKTIRLASQVLARHPDGSSESCSGVPGPPRVIEDCSRQRYQVRISCLNDRLRLLKS